MKIAVILFIMKTLSCTQKKKKIFTCAWNCELLTSKSSSIQRYPLFSHSSLNHESTDRKSPSNAISCYSLRLFHSLIAWSASSLVDLITISWNMQIVLDSPYGLSSAGASPQNGMLDKFKFFKGDRSGEKPAKGINMLISRNCFTIACKIVNCKGQTDSFINSVFGYISRARCFSSCFLLVSSFHWSIFSFSFPLFLSFPFVSFLLFLLFSFSPLISLFSFFSFPVFFLYVDPSPFSFLSFFVFLFSHILIFFVSILTFFSFFMTHWKIREMFLFRASQAIFKKYWFFDFFIMYKV